MSLREATHGTRHMSSSEAFEIVHGIASRQSIHSTKRSIQGMRSSTLTLLNHVDELPRLQEGLEDPRIKPRRAQAIQPEGGLVPDMPD